MKKGAYDSYSFKLASEDSRGFQVGPEILGDLIPMLEINL
jgi:hypothetical protein